MRALGWLGGALLFVAFGYVVCFLLASLSGWRSLAQRYALDRALPQRRRSFAAARVGSVSYRGCLHVSADEHGLYLGVLAVFRAAHAPLFIPWRDIYAAPAASLYGPVIRLRTSAVPQTAIDFPLALAAWVKQQACLDAWPGAAEIISN
jgi:hypothetical protein